MVEGFSMFRYASATLLALIVLLSVDNSEANACHRRKRCCQPQGFAMEVCSHGPLGTARPVSLSMATITMVYDDYEMGGSSSNRYTFIEVTDGDTNNTKYYLWRPIGDKQIFDDAKANNKKIKSGTFHHISADAKERNGNPGSSYDLLESYTIQP
jgi:hypothetical protein